MVDCKAWPSVSGDRRFEGRAARDAIAAVRLDPSCVMVNRNQGSGTRALIDGLLEGVKPAGYAVQPRNHNAVAAAVSQGRADWGLTLDTVAGSAGLGFLPLQEERYDFVVPKSRANRRGVAALKQLLSEPSTRDALIRLGMRPEPISCHVHGHETRFYGRARPVPPWPAE